MLLNCMQRVCLYIAVADMTKKMTVDKTDFKALQEATWERCPHIFLQTIETQIGEFPWSDAQQGHILAGFFVGHLLTGISGGFLADLFGAKQVFGATVLVTSVCTVLSALVAMFGLGPYALMGVRIVMGFAQGPMFPAAASMLSRWSPPEERPFLSSIGNSGIPLGSCLGYLLSGIILYYLPWQWVFYIHAMFGVVWFILWEMFVFSTPDTHRFISPAEHAYIRYSISHDSPPPTGSVPWKEILSSFKFRVVAYANFGFDWGFYIVNIELPFYLRNVLHFPIIKIGIVSALPWLSMWLGSLLFGRISQLLIKEGIFRKIDMRKIMAVLSTIVPSVLLMLASWCTCSHVLVCVLFSLSMFYAGAAYSGIRLSVIDLAPNYAGLLMSMVSTFGTLSGIGVPLIVHHLIKEGGSLMEWRISFWIAFIFMFLTSLPYLLYADCTVQYWNAGHPRPTDDLLGGPPPPPPLPPIEGYPVGPTGAWRREWLEGKSVWREEEKT